MDYFNWVVIFFAISNIVNTRRRLFIFLLIFFLASFKLSFFGARTLVMRGFAFTSWGLRGPEGFFENPGEYAIQMAIFAAMSLYFFIAVKPFLKRWQASLVLLMPATAALTVLGANTRGGQIAIVAQLLVMVAATKHRVKTFFGIAVVVLIGIQLLPSEQMDRFSSMGEDRTSQQRLLYWQHGWQMIKDHPIMGVGYFNFVPYYNLHHSEDIVIGLGVEERSAQLPHNIFVQIGTDMGFPGLIVFVSLLTLGFSNMRACRRAAKDKGDAFFEYLTHGMNLALLGYIVAGQFVTVAYYPFLWVHLAFVVAMRNIQSLESKDTSATEVYAVRGAAVRT